MGILVVLVGMSFVTCAVLDFILLVRVRATHLRNSRFLIQQKPLGYNANMPNNALHSQIHRVYRSSGASISKAQQEFTSGVMRNEHVQGAVANMAAEGVRAGVNSVTSNNSSNNSTRY